jgi:DNA-binding MarR family transcriptional regulator
MQGKRPASTRRDLIAALNRAAREAGGLGNVLAEAGAARLGINLTDYECLDIINLGGQVTAGDLVKATGLTSGAITGVIDRLEKAGLARRRRDAGDRRKVTVTLTGKARRHAAAFADFGRAIDRLTDKYSEAEIALLVDYFARTRNVIFRQIEKLKRSS